MIIKRLFDILAAGGGLIILSPFLLLISLAIKVSDFRSPVFFRQKRIGQYGVPFYIIKFTTMVSDAFNEEKGNYITIANDPRFTTLGLFLNRYKLNELPQLWNVLKGQMSFVGPRPDVEGYADRLTGDDRKILSLKPGLTGPATLKYRNEEELLAQQADPLTYNNEVIWPDKVKINLKYLEEQSLLTDLKYIFRTIFH
ncbi:MAG: sugar transferase [Muribaculaceae bacterium]|nr:sugar transferase [Muribaculaceae bacterium]